MLLGRELLADVADFRCPACHAIEPWSFSGRVRRRSNSVTARISCSGCREMAFLKHVRRRSTGPDEAQAERLFATALQIRERFPAHSGFAVAAPWHRHGSTIVFEIAEGISPLRLLASAPEQEALSLATRIGEWFALFHASLVEAPDAADAPARANDLAGRIEELGARWARSSQLNATAERALAELRLRADGLGREAPSLVCLHGDAKPDNFMVSEGAVTGIDIEGRYWNEPEHDIAQFDVQLRLACTNLLGQFDSRRLAALLDAVVAGYRRHMPLSEARLDALRLWYMLQFWLSWRSASTAHCWRWDRTFGAHLMELTRARASDAGG